jgi:hypothetical protein
MSTPLNQIDLFSLSREEALRVLVEKNNELEAVQKVALGSRFGAYAAQPGTGPEGESCRTCEHSYARQFTKNYWKCGLVPATGGPGTDIRLKSAACEKWEPRAPFDIVVIKTRKA